MGAAAVVVRTLVHVLAGSLVWPEFVAGAAAADEGTHSVLALLLTPSVVRGALVPVILAAGSIEAVQTDAAVVHTVAAVEADERSAGSSRSLEEDHHRQRHGRRQHPPHDSCTHFPPGTPIPSCWAFYVLLLGLLHLPAGPLTPSVVIRYT